MDYGERPPARALQGLVKASWTLEAPGGGGGWITHQATPDGCIELIRRVRGHSRWDGPQPEGFAVGLSERPVGFEISADSSFAGIRLWPWTWSLLSDIPLSDLQGRWAPLAGERLESLWSTLPDLAAADARLIELIGPHAPGLARIGKAIVAASSVAGMSAATGLAPRRLQRWFAAHVGVPPRSYLRLLRFQHAFEQVPGQPSLADHAAAHGFADQAHMAREFKSMAGVPAKQARRSAKGPFLR
jgi:AraC-like DNA-binding protein